MSVTIPPRLQENLDYSRSQYENWEIAKDVIDQLIDLILNYRQSGHPGGSRSKVHALLATMLSGAMRWDIRHPEKRFGDRFVLVAGHTAPVIYTTLAALGDCMRTMYARTGDPKYKIEDHRIVLWEDLINFRRHDGLPGHAEMEGKTLFFKFNTGPSGHGSPAAAGEALALKRAGADEVKVWAFEGEGGLTTGASHETKNSAWGLKLNNLVYVVDWNDFGIDDHPVSMIVPGNPQSWFEPYGWRVAGAEDGSAWEPVTSALLEIAQGDNPKSLPGVVWARTRKGRGYHKFDYKSHGAPHKTNSEEFWACRADFAGLYKVKWEGEGQGPGDADTLLHQMKTNLNVALDVLRNSDACRAIADRLVEIGDSVPQDISTFKLDTSKNPLDDPELTDFENYDPEVYVKPGEQQPNRAALGRWGSYINSWSRKKYGRPLFLVCSADLADSTNISGFGKGFGDTEPWGKFVPGTNDDGALVPQEITEFTNAGLTVGVATVNFSKDPLNNFNGFFAGCSTYGSFSYLKYGPMRLFAQVAQDSDIQVGKVLWVAGHSGPETADDSRTHFGIFAPGVTQLFPEGHVVDIHPWEFNEVPVTIAAALKHPKAHILALHVTRPPIEIPDREALGIPSHFEAAKGAYVFREYKAGQPKMGCIFLQGTSTTANIVRLLPKLDEAGINVKIVAAISPQLFAEQSEAYRNSVISDADRMDSTYISNRSRRVSWDWKMNPLADEYAMTSDYDDRWRTGGNLEEVIEEARLSPEWLLKGIRRFAESRKDRLSRLRKLLDAAEA